MAQPNKNTSPVSQDFTEQVDITVVEYSSRGLIVGAYNPNIKRPVVKSERYFRSKILDVMHEFLLKNAD